jgi:F-box domain
MTAVSSIMLPDEIWLKIFESCSVLTRAKCTFVCENWNRIITSHKWPLAQNLMIALEIVQDGHLQLNVTKQKRQHPFEEVLLKEKLTTVVIQYRYVNKRIIIKLVSAINPLILRIEGSTFNFLLVYGYLCMVDLYISGLYIGTSDIVEKFLDHLPERKILWLARSTAPSCRLPEIGTLIFEGDPHCFDAWSFWLKPRRVSLSKIDTYRFKRIIDTCKENERIEQISLYFNRSEPPNLKIEAFLLFLELFYRRISQIHFDSRNFMLQRDEFLPYIEHMFHKINYSYISVKPYFGVFCTNHHLCDSNMLHVYNYCKK